MNFLKVGKVTAGVVILVGVAGYAALSSIDVESYRGDIIQAAEDATGRKVNISGPIKLKISLTPAVVVEGVDMSNAPWAKAPKMVSIGRAEAEIGLLSAIFGTISVNRLVLHDTSIHLERLKNGQANWEFASKAEDDAQPADTDPATEAEEAKDDNGTAPSIAIQSVDIKNLKLALQDAVSAQDLTVDIKKLGAEARSTSDPVKLVLDMAYNGLPISAKGLVGPIENLTANEESQVDLSVDVPGIKLAVKGEIGEPMRGQDIDLMLNLAATSYADVGKAIGADLSGIPALAFDGKVESFNEAGYRVHDSVLTLSDQKINLAASADLSKPVMMVKANVGADVLDLQKLLDSLGQPAATGDTAAQTSAKTSKASSGGKVFPADPLPMEQLRTVNADAKVAIGSLILPGGLKLKDAKLTTTLKNGKLSVVPNFGLGSGNVSGAINLVTPKKTGASALSVNLKSKDVAVADVVRDMGMVDMISGAPTDVSVALKARGASVKTLMAGLNGKIYVDTGKGIIDNEKLSNAIGSWAVSGLSMIDPGFSQRQNTVLNCMVVNVPVKNGMMSIDNSIAAETDVLNMVVNGDVNLKTEGLDLGFDTQPHGAGTGVAQTATGLVRMGGTLAQPEVGVSVLGAGKAALKVGAAIATGGLSLLGDAVLNEATKDPNPCLTAKGQAPKRSSTSGGSSSKSSTQKTSDTPANAIGGAIKGLFGK